MRIRTRQFATLVILLTSLLLSPVTLLAQAGTSDWSRLSSVSTGSKLSIKLRNGKKVNGTLSGVSDTSLTLLVKNNSTEVKRDDIVTVHQVNEKSATKAALIGMGVGAGAGAIVGAAGDDDGYIRQSVAVGITTILGAGVGALGGWLVGRSGKKRVLVYEAK
jgi:hypothetical protein